MSDTSRAAFLQARQCWPERGQDERILAPARQIYDEWQAASLDTRRIALDAALASGLTRLPGKDSARAQCRELTLFGSPLPGPNATLSPLTLEQVEALGGGRSRRSSVPPARSSSAPPSARKVRGGPGPRVITAAIPPQPAGSPTPALEPEDPSPAHDGGGSPARRSHGGRKRSPSRSRSPSRESAPPPPATNQRVAELERLLASQDERIRQLFAQQLAEPHEDVSSAYVVVDEVWHLLGKHASEDKCSWLSIPALKRREISEIVRTQSGTYPKFPCELDVIGGMKRLPGVKDAQITLLDFAQTEVVKFMRSNARTVRLSGTVFSRSLEM